MILGDDITDNARSQATLSADLGDLGLQEPTDSVEASRLSCLVNIELVTSELRANHDQRRLATNAAVSLSLTSDNSCSSLNLPRTKTCNMN